jgi:hypothetical protein
MDTLAQIFAGSSITCQSGSPPKQPLRLFFHFLAKLRQGAQNSDRASFWIMLD